MNKGMLSAASGYLLWGFFPIYWKQLTHVDATEILLHRMLWSFVWLGLLLTVQQNWAWLRPTLRDRQQVGRFTVAALLLLVNWGLFIWAVNAGYVVEVSLGYFINPLVNVIIGRIVFREKIGRWQQIAVVCALGGVLYLTWAYGRPPWIALTLAFSFALYGLLKKQSSLKAAEGLTIEMALVSPVALIGLFVLTINNSAEFGGDLSTTLYLIIAGIITAVPLLLFAYGAQRIQFTTLGLLQYIAPTLQFCIGVFLYNEPFTIVQLWGFVMIWVGLFIYSADSIRQMRQAG